jgi:hypothetical protein
MGRSANKSPTVPKQRRYTTPYERGDNLIEKYFIQFNLPGADELRVWLVGNAKGRFGRKFDLIGILSKRRAKHSAGKKGRNLLN